MGFLIIPLTILYNEYIDRPKFTEQKKKNPVKYIVPPSLRGRNNKFNLFKKLSSFQMYAIGMVQSFYLEQGMIGILPSVGYQNKRKVSKKYRDIFPHNL